MSTCYVSMLAVGAGTVGALLMALANWPGYLPQGDRRAYTGMMMAGIIGIFLGFMIHAGDCLYREHGIAGLMQLRDAVIANLVVGVLMTVIIQVRKRRRKRQDC